MLAATRLDDEVGEPIFGTATRCVLLLKVKQKKREQSSKPRWNVLPYIITSDALVVPLSLHPSRPRRVADFENHSEWSVGGPRKRAAASAPSLETAS